MMTMPSCHDNEIKKLRMESWLATYKPEEGGFRKAFASVAESTDSTLAPFLLDGVATRPELMQPDGIHPTVEAQPLLLENILPTLESVLAEL